MNIIKKNLGKTFNDNSMTSRVISNQYQNNRKCLKEKGSKFNLNSNSLDNYQPQEEEKKFINEQEIETVKVQKINNKSCSNSRKNLNQQILRLNSFNNSSNLNHILTQKNILKNTHKSTFSPRFYFPYSKEKNNSKSRIKSPFNDEIIRLKDELKANEEILVNKELTIKKMKMSIIKLSTRYSELNSRLEEIKLLKNNNKASEKNITNSQIKFQDDFKSKTQKNWNVKEINSSCFTKEKEKLDKIESLTWIYKGESQKGLKMDKLYLKSQPQNKEIYQQYLKANKVNINNSSNNGNGINQDHDKFNTNVLKDQVIARKLAQLSIRLRNYFQEIDQREVRLVTMLKRILKMKRESLI